MSWKDDKNLGPWSFEAGEDWKVKDLSLLGFVKQLNKLRYNQGNRISSAKDPTFSTDFTGVSVTPIHDPCGYWHSTPKSCLGFHSNRWEELIISTISIELGGNPLGAPGDDGVPVYEWNLIEDYGGHPYDWRFRLYQDSDDTIRDGEGNIVSPSGTLIDVDLMESIYIIDPDSNYVGGIYIKVDYPQYWTLVKGIWYFDDGIDYPGDAWTGSYNPSTGCFTVNFSSSYSHIGGTTYWILYEDNTEAGLASQYPYRYKTADKWAVEDRILPGTYEANIPYWEIRDFYSPEPIELPWNTPLNNYCSEYSGLTYAPGTYGGDVAFKAPFSICKTVKTSIPYKTKYIFEGGGGKGYTSWYGMGNYDSVVSNRCGDVPTCTNAMYNGYIGTHTPPAQTMKDATMYYTDDGLVDLSFYELYYESPSIKEFESGWKNAPASIGIEGGAILNIQTVQTNFCYVCVYWGWTEEEGWHWMSSWYPTSLIYVKISQFGQAVKLYVNYE